MVDVRRTVILIEDHHDTADLATTFLSILGYSVLIAETRDEALKLLDSHGAPDCIVSDWFMPGMSMPEFMEKLRERHIAVPVLAVSAAPQVAEKAAILKIDRHLKKPYTLDDLGAAIAACIELRREK